MLIIYNDANGDSLISWFNKGKPHEVWTVANILIDNKSQVGTHPASSWDTKVLDVNYLNSTLSVYLFSNVPFIPIKPRCFEKNQRSYGETFNSYGNEILFTWCVAKKALSGSDRIFIHLHQVLGWHKWKKSIFHHYRSKSKGFWYERKFTWPRIKRSHLAKCWTIILSHHI